LKSVTFVFGVSWCENNDFNHVLKLNHLGSDIFQPLPVAKGQHDEQSGTKKNNKEKNAYGLVEPFFNLKICNDFSFESPFSYMLVRPDRR